MRPNTDSDSYSFDSENFNDSFAFARRNVRLAPGHIRYVRMLEKEGRYGEPYFETVVRHSLLDDDWESQLHPIRYQDDPDRWILYQKFSYTAISYAWGDPTPRHLVDIDGLGRMVADNLWTFLQRTKQDQATARHNLQVLSELAEKDPGLDKNREVPWSIGWLWIDALCIDQSDVDERTHQVGIMSEIFGRADRVVSWLGSAYDNSQHAMAAISRSQDNYKVNFQIIAQTELSEAICRLCERPYWKRLWVFQELRHANHISLMCGDATISWNEFRDLWRVIVDIAATTTTSQDYSERLRQSLATRMITLRMKPMDFSLWNLLRETKTLDCADQRDRIYALLSVASEGHEDILADYYRPIPDLAHHVLRNKHTLSPPKTLDNVLSDCQLLGRLLGLSENEMLTYSVLNSSECVRVTSAKAEPSASWVEWAEDRGHEAVVKLLHDRYGLVSESFRRRPVVDTGRLIEIDAYDRKY